jgi:DNA-binding MarR family transcriptional regulator
MAKSLSLDKQLCFSIYAAGHAFNRFYKVLLDPLGLTYPQYLVLLTLWDSDGLGVKAIGERLGLDSGTLTPLLKRMESAGLVRRARSAADERLVDIHLTAAGTALRAKAESFPELIQTSSGCSADELKGLRKGLNRLRAQLLAQPI